MSMYSLRSPGPTTCITDAVLLAAAIQRGGVLATLDNGLARLVDERERRSVRVIPV